MALLVIVLEARQLAFADLTVHVWHSDIVTHQMSAESSYVSMVNNNHYDQSMMYDTFCDRQGKSFRYTPESKFKIFSLLY